MVVQSTKLSHNTSSSETKRRRSNNRDDGDGCSLIQQNAFLLPKGNNCSSEHALSPIPFFQHEPQLQQGQFPLVRVANPLAHPIGRAFQVQNNNNKNGEDGIPQPAQRTTNSLGAVPQELGLMTTKEVTDLNIINNNGGIINHGTIGGCGDAAAAVGNHHLDITNYLIHPLVPDNYTHIKTDHGRQEAVDSFTHLAPDPPMTHNNDNPDATSTTNNNFQHLQPHSTCTALVERNILVSPMKATSKKRSTFWQAFHQFNTKHPENKHDHHAACNLCGKIVNMGRDNSTTTLSQHLRKCNRELWVKLKDTTTATPPVASTVGAVPSPMMLPRKKQRVQQVRNKDKLILEGQGEGVLHQKGEEVTAETEAGAGDGARADNSRSKDNALSSSTAEIVSPAATTGPFAPSMEAMKHYIEVAYWIRFKDPPQDEWAGLITILYKELAPCTFSKEAIRGIFKSLSRKVTTGTTGTTSASRKFWSNKKSNQRRQQQFHATTINSTLSTTPTSATSEAAFLSASMIPALVNDNSASSSLSSPCHSPVLLNNSF